MLKKPSMYDDVQVNLEYEKIELGGHRGVIKHVEEYTSSVSGNTSLKVEVDTSSDDRQPNFFQKQFDENPNMDKKWSNSAIKYVSLKEEENCVKMLKAFITSVENSNPGFTYDWNKEANQLNGKKVGLLFGLEEYQNDKGETKTTTKLNSFRSIDKVEALNIPKVRLIDNSTIEYEEYQKRQQNQNTNNTSEEKSSLLDDNFLD